jgi:predicted ArsR family transcriptional regulator
MQLALDISEPLARRTDPATSHQAASQAKELRIRHHGVIMACLFRHGPLGKDGIAARTRLDGVAVCRRLTELERAGLIVQTGKNVQSTAGRAEREWRVA